MILNLSDYRARRQAAIAYHPAVWTPSDAIQTANDFHDWADVAEYGTIEPARPDAAWYVGQSRARKAKWHNRAAVALLLAASAFLGAIAYAASAKADDPVAAYEWQYGPAACSYLSTHNSIAGLSAVLLDAESLGLTPEQAGQAVAGSVLDLCPEYTPVLRAFVLRYGPQEIA
jgi:hypothetical protein